VIFSEIGWVEPMKLKQPEEYRSSETSYLRVFIRWESFINSFGNVHKIMTGCKFLARTSAVKSANGYFLEVNGLLPTAFDDNWLHVKPIFVTFWDCRKRLVKRTDETTLHELLSIFGVSAAPSISI
jgi:hypothetical protein